MPTRLPLYIFNYDDDYKWTATFLPKEIPRPLYSYSSVLKSIHIAHSKFYYQIISTTLLHLHRSHCSVNKFPAIVNKLVGAYKAKTALRALPR